MNDSTKLVPVTVRLTEEEAQRLDERRGQRSRQYIFKGLASAFIDGKLDVPQPPPTVVVSGEGKGEAA
ncbi:MAG: hypothetical protein AB1656_04905 [Candidatus Omnitrophota bacterium]